MTFVLGIIWIVVVLCNSKTLIEQEYSCQLYMLSRNIESTSGSRQLYLPQRVTLTWRGPLACLEGSDDDVQLSYLIATAHDSRKIGRRLADVRVLHFLSEVLYGQKLRSQADDRIYGDSVRRGAEANRGGAAGDDAGVQEFQGR